MLLIAIRRRILFDNIQIEELIFLLLTTRSIMECFDDEVEDHNDEIRVIEQKICELSNHDCIAVMIFVDEANKKKHERQFFCKLHNFMEMIEYADIKNGIDIKIGDNDLLTIVAYGQAYKFNNSHGIVEEYIHILPISSTGEFVDIGLFLRNCKIKESRNKMDN